MTRPVLIARDFLIAGGRITFDEWMSLDDEQRSALTEAGEEVMQEQADRMVVSIADALMDVAERYRLDALLKEAEKVVS